MPEVHGFMKEDIKDWVNDLIYITYKNLSLHDFIKNIYSFLYMHMHVSYIGVYEYNDGVINSLYRYAPFEDIVVDHPKQIEVHADILKAIYLDVETADMWKAAKICRCNEGHPYCKFFEMMFGGKGECIYLPLNYGDVFDFIRFINIYSTIENYYREEHRELCEALRVPLRAALAEVLRKQDKLQRRPAPLSPSDGQLCAPSALAGTPGFEVKSLDEWTAQYIRQVIQYANGRISGKNGAAALLGLPPTTLWSKMRKLNINPRE